jgi:hypothetical protein
VTPRHVLLPAHCIQNKGEKQADNAFDAGIIFENDLYDKMADISKFIVHPDWDPEDEHYTADIATAVLTECRNLTETIGHVCLNTPSNPIQSFAGKTAVVFGWDLMEKSELRMESELHHIEVSLVDQAECNSSNSTLQEIMSDTSFCAGAGDGKSGPSNGKHFYVNV